MRHFELICDDVEVISFSPDGKYLASGGSNGNTIIWDVKNKTCVKTLKKTNAPITSIYFNPNEKYLLSGGTGDFAIWLTESRECVWDTAGQYAQQVWVDDTIKYLAISSLTRGFELWDFKAKKFIKKLMEDKYYATSVDFSSDGKYLAIGIYNTPNGPVIMIWNLELLECVRYLQGHSKQISSICFSSDSRYLASGSSDGTIRIWNTETWECIEISSVHKTCVTSLHFSPDGKWLASGGDDKTIRLWNIDEWRCSSLIKVGSFEIGCWIQSICFSPDSKHIACCTTNNIIRFWHV